MTDEELKAEMLWLVHHCPDAHWELLKDAIRRQDHLSIRALMGISEAEYEQHFGKSKINFEALKSV